MSSNNNARKPEFPTDEDGLPRICLQPRNGQVIVTPHTVRKSQVLLPEGEMSQLLYEKVARVLAVGPGRASMVDSSRMAIDLKRGDLVFICCSDQIADGTLTITDPTTPIVLLAVDENSIVAKVDAEVLNSMFEERKKAESGLTVVGE